MRRVSTVLGAVVAVGDELLLGDIVNTNAAWLGEALAGVGVHVVHSSAVGDHVGRLVTALRRALEDADVVVVTGGLGPTVDDLTRDALAIVGDAPLQRETDLERDLADRFAGFGIAMPEQVLRQADVPRGALTIDNPVGTAYGLRLVVGDRVLYAVPGPPHELQAVMLGGVLPELAARTGSRVTTRTLRCSGVGESEVAERVEAALGAIPADVDLAYLAGSGVVRVRLSTDGDPTVLEPLVSRAAEALGSDVWGRDGDDLPSVVLSRLVLRGETLATAESFTGGLLAASLTSVPGSSGAYRGGLVPYATALKVSMAGVPLETVREHGAVSAQTAVALAEGARAAAGATWGIATTGVAGPDEQEGRPVGTVHLAVAGPDGTTVLSRRVPGDRERVRVLSGVTLLDQLRRRLDRAEANGAPSR